MNRAQEKIVDRLIEAMERGIIPWRRPWFMPTNAVSGKSYRGINQLVLSIGEFADPRFLTFLQAQQLGGSVKQGEKGFPVVLWHFPTAEEVRNDPNARVWAKGYTVFNVLQCEGLMKLPVLAKTEHDSMSQAQAIMDNWTDRPGIDFGGYRASYNSLTDKVSMPETGKFSSPEAYYDTMFHELIHSTGHPSRLNRESLTMRQEYAVEELIAEIGGAMLCAEAHIDNTNLTENNAAYLQSWLTTLRKDKTMILKAASSAAKAADLILGRNQKGEEPMNMTPETQLTAAA